MYWAVDRENELSQQLGTCEELKKWITKLANLLLDLKSPGSWHGACWGYNFGWQARRVFYFPKYTPTVVATSFCASALIAAYEVTKDKTYLETALSSANFVLHDLRRTPFNGGYLFSYSPVEGNDKVFNASLLGSKLLAMCYKYTGNEEFKNAAQQSIVACASAQQDNVAWLYGMLNVQQWVDSFHTGYNLDAMIAYQDCTGDSTFNKY
ncbi:MAG: delta-aminolevulinic acid dehydratase, partial [Muribaculaceae bacterium]|nr:delta-aminolevulinic acid dehydratase [Muribaculaceae bacterium]